MAEKKDEPTTEETIAAADTGSTAGGSEVPGQDAASQKAEAAGDLAAAGPEDAEPVKVVVAKKEASSGKFLARFLKVSGYDEEQVLDYDERRRTVVTQNGGKYHLLRDGTLRTTGGPQFPNYTPPSGE